jgi:hypothetical protein
MTSLAALAMVMLEILNLRQIDGISGNPNALSRKMKMFDLCFMVRSFVCGVILNGDAAIRAVLFPW